MTRNELRCAAVCAVLLCLVASCKKSDDTPSRKTMLTGQWILSGIGFDVNQNNIPDSGEVTSAATAGQSALVTFNSDMTYSLLYTAGTTDTFKGTWNLTNGDAVIHTAYNVNSGTATSTKDLDIYSLNNSTLTVLDKSDSTHVWETFQKQ